MENISVKVVYKDKIINIGKGIQNEQNIANELQKRFAIPQEQINLFQFAYEDNATCLSEAYEKAIEKGKQSVKIKIQSSQFENNHYHSQKSKSNNNTFTKLTKENNKEQVKLLKEGKKAQNGDQNKQQEEPHVVFESKIQKGQQLEEKVEQKKAEEQRFQQFQDQKQLADQDAQKDRQEKYIPLVGEMTEQEMKEQKVDDQSEKRYVEKDEQQDKQKEKGEDKEKQEDQGEDKEKQEDKNEEKDQQRQSLIEGEDSSRQKIENILPQERFIQLKQKDSVQGSVEQQQQSEKSSDDLVNTDLMNVQKQKASQKLKEKTSHNQYDNLVEEGSSPTIKQTHKQNSYQKLIAKLQYTEFQAYLQDKQRQQKQQKQRNKEQGKQSKQSKQEKQSTKVQNQPIPLPDPNTVHQLIKQLQNQFNHKFSLQQNQYNNLKNQHDELKASHNDLKAQHNDLKSKYQYLALIMQQDQILKKPSQISIKYPSLSQQQQKKHSGYIKIPNQDPLQQEISQFKVDIQQIDPIKQIQLGQSINPQYFLTNTGTQSWPSQVFVITQKKQVQPIKSLKLKQETIIELGQVKMERIGQNFKRQYQLGYYTKKGKLRLFGEKFGVNIKCKEKSKKIGKQTSEFSLYVWNFMLERGIKGKKLEQVVVKLREMGIDENNYSKVHKQYLAEMICFI